MYLRVAISICTSLITLAGSAAVNTRPGALQANSLAISESANFTGLESFLLNGSSPDLRSRGPQCLESMGTPPLSSCMEALSLMPRNREQVIFGQRRSIGLVDHVMPYDLISSDGLCAIRFWTDVEGYNREATTNSQLASAVDAILVTCLQGQLRGGYIAGLGTRGHLQVSVTFNIDVRTIKCFDAPDTPPMETGCSNLLDTVPVKAERQIFGPKENYGVDVVLPQTFRERKHLYSGCVIAIDSLEGQSMAASWLLLFSAANTVNAMCVRQGKEGQYVAYEFGLKKAVVGLYNQYPPRI